jgi:hypothetical protein
MAEQITWEDDIKDLFTQLDIGCMRARGTVDLSSYESVKKLFNPIFIRVENGSMPKGGPAWPKEKVDLLKKWKEAGFPEK